MSREEVMISEAKMRFLLWLMYVVATLAILFLVFWMKTVESRFKTLEDRVEEAEITNLLQEFP